MHDLDLRLGCTTDNYHWIMKTTKVIYFHLYRLLDLSIFVCKFLFIIIQIIYAQHNTVSFNDFRDNTNKLEIPLFKILLLHTFVRINTHTPHNSLLSSWSSSHYCLLPPVLCLGSFLGDSTFILYC